MKYSDISGLAPIELLKKKNELSGQLFEARMKNSLGQLGNPMAIRHIRRDVARINTALKAAIGFGRTASNVTLNSEAKATAKRKTAAKKGK